MNLLVDRPSAHDVSLHLFRRPVHPELFQTLARREVARDDYTLTVRITPTGHVLHWRSPELHLTEIMAARGEPLPSRGHVWRRRFQGESSDSFRASTSIVYQMSSHAERLPEHLFAGVHEELVADGLQRGFLHRFRTDEPWRLAPLGFVTADARYGCLVVNAFHTFPAECTILKSQTLIERVESAR